VSAKQPRGDRAADLSAWWDARGREWSVREREQAAALTRVIAGLLTITPPQYDDATAAYAPLTTDKYVGFLKPTDEELVLRKIERLLKTPALRRNLRRSKWPHYKVVDEEMRIRRGKRKQLPNGAKEEALKVARKRIYEAEGKDFNTHTIRKTYYEVRGLLRKAQTSP
jgi:hypothetical protein